MTHGTMPGITDKKLQRQVFFKKLTQGITFGGSVGCLCMCAILGLLLPRLGIESDLVILICVPGAILCFLIGLPLMALAGARLKKTLTVITHEVLDEVLERLDEYDPQRSVNEALIEDGKSGLPSFDKIRGQGDYISGVLRGVEFESGDFTLAKRNRKSSFDHKSSYSTFYTGRMLVCRHTHPLHGGVTVSQHCTYHEATKTGDPVFDQRFSVYADDPGDVAAFLTEERRAALLALCETLEKKRKLCMHLWQEGLLTCTVSGLDFFEVKKEKSIEALRQSYKDQLDTLAQLLLILGAPTEIHPK